MFCLWWSGFDGDINIRVSDVNDHFRQLPEIRHLSEQNHNTAIASTHPWESPSKLAEQLLTPGCFHYLDYHDHSNMHSSCHNSL